MSKFKVKELGYLRVDSDILTIGDPYIFDEKINTIKPSEIKNLKSRSYCQHIDNEDKTIGISVVPGHGSGLFPVYGEFDDNGVVRKVFVDFLNEMCE